MNAVLISNSHLYSNNRYLIQISIKLGGINISLDQTIYTLTTIYLI